MTSLPQIEEILKFDLSTGHEWLLSVTDLLDPRKLQHLLEGPEDHDNLSDVIYSKRISYFLERVMDSSFRTTFVDKAPREVFNDIKSRFT